MALSLYDQTYDMSEFTRRFVAAQIVGGRERQEDDFAILDLSDDRRERLLFVVTDGMGGHAGAAKASHFATRQFCKFVESCEGPLASRLRPALDSANTEIALSGVRDTTIKGAGCTLVAAALEDGALSWISVGDSCLFLFRDRQLRKLNADHSTNPRSGKIGAALGNSRRRVLQSALTGNELKLVDSSQEPFRLFAEDSIILASDGLEILSNRKIASILTRSERLSPAAVVARLLKAVQAGPRHMQDNTTIVFYRARPGSRRDLANRALSPKRRSFWKLFLAVLLCAALLFVAVQWISNP